MGKGKHKEDPSIPRGLNNEKGKKALLPLLGKKRPFG